MGWILDQTKKMSINSHNCNYIYIETKTNTLKAVTKSVVDGNAVKLSLGTYNSLDDCLEILHILNSHLEKCDWIEMPLGGDFTKFVTEFRTLGS